MKKITFKQQTLLLLLPFLIVACSEDLEITYSPSSPKAGETITFSNNAVKGDDWSWDFGDGSTSTNKSPTKTYRKAGTYLVRLQIDKQSWRTVTKEITVFDSIPSFTSSIENVDTDSLTQDINGFGYIYSSITFSTNVYNPFKYDVSYEWHLPETAVITENTLTSSSITAYFKQTGKIDISIDITVNGETNSVKKTYFLRDTITPLLTIAHSKTDKENIFYQYIYDIAMGDILPEEPSPYKRTSSFLGKPVRSLLVRHDTLFCFGGHSTIAGNNIYAISQDTIYYAFPAAKVFVTGKQLQGLPSAEWGGIGYGNGVFFLGTSSGIYRFTEKEAIDAATPALPIILEGKDIKNLCIDSQTQRVYFIADNTLFICMYDGSVVQEIAPCTGAVSIDSDNRYLYFSQTEGVYRLPLIKTINNVTPSIPEKVNELTSVTAVYIDSKEF